MKTCGECGETKPVEMFSAHKGRPDGLQSMCKCCATARYKEWSAANRECVAAKDKAWRESNRERKAASDKAWREANRESKAAYNKAHYAENRERQAALAGGRT